MLPLSLYEGIAIFLSSALSGGSAWELRIHSKNDMYSYIIMYFITEIHLSRAEKINKVTLS